MKTVKNWSFRPYTELHRPGRGERPYICRLAPGKRGFTVDFIDNGAPDDEHLIFWRTRGEGEFSPVRPDRKGNFFTAEIVCGELRDYEVYAERQDGARSSTRLVRTGDVPGTVINYLHPEDDEYAVSGR